MRYLTLREVLELYRQVMEIGGGTTGIRDLDALQSSIAQPRMTYAGQELYEGIVAKAAALDYLLIMNHPFEHVFFGTESGSTCKPRNPLNRV